MQADGYVHAVREDLGRMAALGDEAVVRAAELLAAALETSLGLRLQEALSEAALELSGQLPHGHVEVRVAGGDPELVYVADEPGPEPTSDADDGVFSARITLRLPENLKSRVEDAATHGGTSVNTWIVRALERASQSRSQSHANRNRMTGFGRS
jgi:hypothetical protein